MSHILNYGYQKYTNLILQTWFNDNFSMVSHYLVIKAGIIDDKTSKRRHSGGQLEMQGETIED